MICRHKLYHFTVANTRFTAPLTRRGKTKFATVKWYNLCRQIIQSQTCYPLIYSSTIFIAMLKKRKWKCTYKYRFGRHEVIRKRVFVPLGFMGNLFSIALFVFYHKSGNLKGSIEIIAFQMQHYMEKQSANINIIILTNLCSILNKKSGNVEILTILYTCSIITEDTCAKTQRIVFNHITT